MFRRVVVGLFVAPAAADFPLFFFVLSLAKAPPPILPLSRFFLYALFKVVG